MTDAKCLLIPELDKIAEEHDYNDYKKEINLVNTGGANYSSQLFTITLSASGKDDLKLFAKVATLSEELRSLTPMQIFEVEITFYNILSVSYREYEAKYNFPEDSRMVLPKYYGGSTEHMKETLVIEDLTCKGYEPFDRFKCYDWEYASKCISALARLHALSVRYEKDNPDTFAELVEKLRSQIPINEIKSLLEKRIKAAIEATDDKHKERLEKFIKENLTEEKMIEFYDYKRKVVLNHGDVRPSNIMHRRDKDGNLDLILLDYQILQKGNPVTDLLYFLISGSDEDFREKHLSQYFEHYYEEFSKTLRWMEINPEEVYSKADYDADVKEMLPFGITLAILILPIITVEVENVPKLENGLELDVFAVGMSNLCKIRFNGILNDYVKMGIL